MSSGTPAAPPDQPVGTGRVVLDDAAIARAITRIAHEVVERNHSSADVVVLGIPTRGAHLARRLAARVLEADGRPASDLDAVVGVLDVTMHRDDLRRQPVRAIEPTTIPAGGLDDRVVVLVDDVLYSGRTVRAALDAVSDLGRPRAVQLAVLVDRGHRELPIRADFIGKNLPTSTAERVSVRVAETDGLDAVTIEPGTGEGGTR